MLQYYIIRDCQKIAKQFWGVEFKLERIERPKKELVRKGAFGQNLSGANLLLDTKLLEDAVMKSKQA